MAKNILLPDRDPLYPTSYLIESTLNYADEDRFIVNIKGEIKVSNEDDDKRALIGKVEMYKVLIDLGKAKTEKLFFIFDTTQLTCDVGTDIFDFDLEDWSDKVYRHLKAEKLPVNLLLIYHLSLLPNYRGKEISYKIIKDIYNIFHDGCLIVLYTYPYQTAYLYSEDPWMKRLELNKLSEIKSDERLNSYVKKIGFHSLPGIDSSILILNPKLNRKFNSIVLD